MLYLAGGGRVFPPRAWHWRFLALLAHETTSNIHVALYPRAPIFTYRNVMAFLLPVYRQLIARSGIRLIAMGDSAGGAVALSLLLTAREEDLPMPLGLVRISPAVDLTFSNPEMEKMEARDPMLALAGARAGAA